MSTFSNIKELLSSLHKEERLISAMFKERKSFNYKYDYALELVDNDDNRLQKLINRSVIRKNGNNLEIDDLFLQFFEQIFDANEEINTSYINENIEIVKQNIHYYFNETNEQRKYNYLRQIKYLKDQFILESSTDFKAVLNANNAALFEPNPQYPLKLSLEYLQSNEAVFESIKKIAKRIKSGVKIMRPVADKISEEYLETQIEEEIQISLEDVKNGFVASGHTLFDFVLNYNFIKPVSFDEKITIYCQLISQYESIFDITDKYQLKENTEFAIVYPLNS